MKKIFWLFLAFAAAFSTSLAETSFESNSDGISVEISLDAGDIFVNDSFGKFLDIASEYSALRPDAMRACPEFSLAVPDYDNAALFYDLSGETALADDFREYFDGSELRPSVTIEYLGSKRGADIARVTVNPFGFSGGAAYFASEIRFDLDFGESVGVADPTPFEVGFFANVENLEHINSILKRSDMEKARENLKSVNEKALQDYDFDSLAWFDPGATYVRFTTERDGLSIVSADRIVSEESSFSGKSWEGFRLFKDGLELPFLVRGDSDGVLNSGDELIFRASRNAGDTTWYDAYSYGAVFFLTWSEDAVGLRYEAGALTNGGEEVTSVTTDEHFEKELKYHYSIYTDRNEKIVGEGWFWGFADPFLEPFSADVYLSGSPSDADSVEISGYFASSEFNRYAASTGADLHRLKIYVNGEEKLDFSFKPQMEILRSFKIPANILFPGLNRITVQGVGIEDKDGVTITPDVVSVDYFEARGGSAPRAFEGKAAFRVESRPNDFTIKVPGFSDSEIVAFDRLSEEIYFPTAERGIDFAASAVNTEGNAVSVFLDTAEIYASGRSIAVAYSVGEFSEAKTFSVAPDAVEYLKSIPAGASVAFACSGTGLGTDIVGELKNLGAERIEEFDTEKAYVFAKIPGSAEVYEKISADEPISVSDFVSNEGGGSYRSILNLSKNRAYDLLLADRAGLVPVEIESEIIRDLYAETERLDLIVITHKKFMNSAEQYAEYRESSRGLAVGVFDVDDIYFNFNFGKKSPYAIRRFLRYAYDFRGSPAPGYVTIWGDACWDSRKTRPGTIYEDYIPTYGIPVSDHWYVLLDGDDYLAEASIGRVPIVTDDQGELFLRKLQDYDKLEPRTWMKKFLFLSGGDTDGQRQEFADYANVVGDFVIRAPIGGDTLKVAKNDNSVGASQGPYISSIINDGVVWVNYLGHGSPRIFGMDGWGIQYLRNEDKYSFLTTISCNTGVFAEPELICRNETYLFEESKGFIGAGGSTSSTDVTMGTNLLYRVLEGLSKKSRPERRYGDLINYGKEKINYEGYEPIILLFSLLGDPVSELPIKNFSDMYLLDDEISIVNREGSTILIDEGVATISGFAYNGGYCTTNSLHVELIRTYEGESDTSKIKLNSICLSRPFSFEIPVDGKPGKHEITITVDSDFETDDENRSNNVFRTTIDVFNKGLLPLEPLDYWSKKPVDPEFRVINPFSEAAEYDYEFVIRAAAGEETIKTSEPGEISVLENYVRWTPKVNLVPGENYLLVGKSTNSETGIEGKELLVRFHASHNPEYRSTSAKISGESGLSAAAVENMILLDDAARIVEDTLRLEAFSVTGYPHPDSSVIRYCKISAGDQVYVVPDPHPPVGVSIVVLSGENGEFLKEKYFDTWDEDSSSINLVNFWRDSIDTGDYVILVTCDVPWNIPFILNDENPESVGSMDTLVAEFRKSGSKFADSLDWSNSFAFIARRGFGFIAEAYSTDRTDTSFVSTDLFFKKRFASIEFPAMGPAKEWRNIKIVGDLSPGDYSLKTVLYGSRYPGDLEELAEYENLTEIDPSGIDAEEYPYLSAKVEFSDIGAQASPTVDSYSLDFEPVTEFASIKSETYVSRELVMRGESDTLFFALENISARTPSAPTIAGVKIYSSQRTIEEFDESVPGLEPNEIYSFERKVDTEFFDKINIAEISVNKSDKPRELYDFNNEAQSRIELFEDDSAPEIVLYMDSVRVFDGADAAVRPFVEIFVYDNSPLAIRDSSKIRLRFNGNVFYPSTDLPEFEFDSYDTGDLKMRVAFVYDSLDYGQNIIRIIADDATGNSDTLEVDLYSTLNGYFENVLFYPNPTTGSAKLRFDYAAPDRQGSANLTIFNSVGRKIRKIEIPPAIGGNEIEWNGLGDYGESTPSGLYFYRLEMVGAGYVEPKFGKFVIVR